MTPSPTTLAALADLARHSSFPSVVLKAQSAVVDDLIARQEHFADGVPYLGARDGASRAGMSPATWRAAMGESGPWVSPVSRGQAGAWEDGHPVAAGWDVSTPGPTDTVVTHPDFLNPGHQLWVAKSGLGASAWRIAVATDGTIAFSLADARGWTVHDGRKGELSRAQLSKVLASMQEKLLISSSCRGHFVWNSFAVDMYDDSEWSHPSQSQALLANEQRMFNRWHLERTAIQASQSEVAVSAPVQTSTEGNEDRIRRIIEITRR